jgi:DNA-binding beta-propeller fold protein YncE
MKLSKIARTIICLAPALLLGLSSPAQPSPTDTSENGLYRVSQIFHIGGEGGWDYLTVDPEHHLLYVPRTTHTMVIDAPTGKIVADIPGQQRNHGVALVPAAGRGFITDGSDGSVTVFDLKTYAVLGKVKTADDSDGVIYDPASGKVLVVCGDPGLLIPISPDLDLATGKADAPVDLGGKPEFLAADGKGKAYINLVNKNEVAVVDTRMMQVVNKWPTAPGGSPTAMSMDAARHLLYIGCRRPQKLVVMDADDGKVLADFPIGMGVDASKFDGDDFASCGDGTLTVVSETSPGKFEVIQKVQTPRGARTMGVDLTTHTLYLPTAELEPQQGQGRPRPKPGTFMIVVVSPSGVRP